MKTPTIIQNKNQMAVMKDDLVSAIHDRLLDENGLDLAHSFNAACVEIASLYAEIDEFKKQQDLRRLRQNPF